MPRPAPAFLLLAALAVLASSCALGERLTAPPADPEQALAACTPRDCVVVDVAVSPEKTGLLTDLAKSFNASETTIEGRRVVIRPKEKASGEAEEQLARGWAESRDDPQPAIWTPASTAWGAVLDDDLSSRGRPAMAGTPTPVMRSPLVIAMPRRMAEALGHPTRPIGWGDILALAQDPRGWAIHGHPEWGQFRLGKTNPRFSTSGLHAWIAQHYAAVGRTFGLTPDDLDAPAVTTFNRTVESSVVHYGDTTLTFLDNWFRADQRGNPYRYASAVAVEEKSVIDYNLGNPDGIDEPDEVARRPREPLVAIYPKEGTIFSDSPFYVLDAEWVSPAEREAARAFLAFVQRPESQARIAAVGFRPATGSSPVSDAATAPGVDAGAGQIPGATHQDVPGAPASPLTRANGVDPTQPRTLLEPPSGAVVRRMLETWKAQRKSARVLLVVDVSGSMAEEAAPGQSKLALARLATEQALAQFRDDDLVGLRVFSTGLGPARDQLQLDLAPIAPIGLQRDQLRRVVGNLAAENGTPLYGATLGAAREMVDSYDPTRINAVVLLSDGRNEDGETADDKRQRDDLVRFLQSQTQGASPRPVQLFTIGYGGAADAGVLQQMADATNGRYYGATADPTTIAKVFLQVVSNF